MIRTIAVVPLISLLLLARPAGAAEPWSQRFQYEPGAGKYTGSENTWDLFGSWRVRDDRGFFEGRPGIGLGINHFFNPWLGVGADTRVEKFDWPNHFNGSLILRYPIKDTAWAPYVLAGFGRQFHDTPQWTGHFGGGADFRLNQTTGLFLEIRQTICDTSRDFVLWRFGVRLKF